MSHEPWEGQTAVLAGAAVAGRRAAAWVRSLPAPPLPVPVGDWLAGELPAAIETAMASLDPEECDHTAPHGRAVDGTGGADTGTVTPLAAVPVVLAEADWLAPDQQARLLAVASAVTGAVRLIAHDPGTAILHGLLARVCAVLDHAARPDGVAWAPAETGGYAVAQKFEHRF
ncbi:hypothetical protein [Streptomyces sp. OspMP-M43]|uniref:hypothetical protein n=1 Tax=Streptomyces sp. OspMP-M43 TaxID=1839781 RepID=UPI00081B20CE|nr:hypothetical protein [Streptomyces sp. OspMP-M43]SCE62038.1 hypothetical protein GA0115261_1122211 [Streptomyces sp. OspMP-M43]